MFEPSIFQVYANMTGKNYRDLHPWEIGQIAGRAGRYKRDGYFGTLAESSEKMRDWLVEQVEQQSFSSVSKNFTIEIAIYVSTM